MRESAEMVYILIEMSARVARGREINTSPIHCFLFSAQIISSTVSVNKLSLSW